MATWLILGLGNPGSKYEGTRHNIGFEVVDALRNKWKLSDWKQWENSVICRGAWNKEELIAAKPTTFMNLSGEAAGVLSRYYKVPVDHLIVVHDEMDFLPAEVRIKVGGGHGGHNGLKSIMQHLGRDFLRIRVGIGKAPAHLEGADFVLSRYSKNERLQMDGAVVEAMEAIEMILEKGTQAAMNQMNRSKKNVP